MKKAEDFYKERVEVAEKYTVAKFKDTIIETIRAAQLEVISNMAKEFKKKEFKYSLTYDKGLVDTLQTSWIDNRLIKPEEATMELSDRRLVKFAMCGWLQDTNSWDNLFAVRGKGTGTQSITGIVVDNIKKLIYA